MKDLRMYFLVNKDLEISKGKLAGQVGHAANILTYKLCKANDKTIEEYMQGQIKKIILACPQTKLETLEQEGFITIRDNGLTELEPGTLTCVTIGILEKTEIPESLKFIKKLRVY